MPNVRLHQYIINCIDLEDYGPDYETSSIHNLVRATQGIFTAEKHYCIHKYGERQAAEDWLRGLCSAVHIEYCDYEIVLLIDEMQLGFSVDEWWTECAQALLDVFGMVRVSA